MNIIVKLLHVTPIEILVGAIRQCYESQDKSDSEYIFQDGEYNYELGERDRALIETIIKSDHTSTLEHITFNFKLSGYSRALLQEKSRHRIASVSEKSTRYCLAKLKKEKCFYDKDSEEILKKYLVFTGIEQVDNASISALENLRLCIVNGISNDKAKYCLPDSLKSECYFTINARSLRNFFELRTSPRALWEIQNLAYAMFDALPDNYKFLFENTLSK